MNTEKQKCAACGAEKLCRLTPQGEWICVPCLREIADATTPEGRGQVEDEIDEMDCTCAPDGAHERAGGVCRYCGAC